MWVGCLSDKDRNVRSKAPGKLRRRLSSGRQESLPPGVPTKPAEQGCEADTPRVAQPEPPSIKNPPVATHLAGGGATGNAREFLDFRL